MNWWCAIKVSERITFDLKSNVHESTVNKTKCWLSACIGQNCRLFLRLWSSADHLLLGTSLSFHLELMHGSSKNSMILSISVIQEPDILQGIPPISIGLYRREATQLTMTLSSKDINAIVDTEGGERDKHDIWSQHREVCKRRNALIFWAILEYSEDCTGTSYSSTLSIMVAANIVLFDIFDVLILLITDTWYL